MTVHSLNIGGGPKFKHHGWMNLDDVSANPLALSPHCVFPISDGSINLIYSSHTLEHLDDPTVARVLLESRRVLNPKGTLLIKIPDFDDILERYRNNDLSYFQRWPNIRVMTETARNRGVAVNITSLAAQCFCGFWNKEFGHLFGHYNTNNVGAYYGPPVIRDEQLRTIMQLQSPHAIAVTLRTHVIATERDYTFNHQNAWSRREFRTRLALGFAVLDDDADRIVAAYPNVPGIIEHRNISAYYLATPI